MSNELDMATDEPTRPVIMSFDGSPPATAPASRRREVSQETPAPVFILPPKFITKQKVGLTSADLEALSSLVQLFESDPNQFHLASGFSTVNLENVFSYLSRWGVHQYHQRLQAQATLLSNMLQNRRVFVGSPDGQLTIEEGDEDDSNAN